MSGAPAIATTFFLVATALLSACADSTRPRGPGSIFISSSSSLVEPGTSFQYEIALDNGTPRTVNVNETVSYIVNGLAHGGHVVDLRGLPSTCDAGGSQRNVNLAGDDTALVLFNIECERISGDLRIVVTTTGPDPDLDGYVVLLNSLGAIGVPSNGQVMLQFMPPGIYSVSLGNVASNCTASATQSATITAGALTTVNFTVTCVPVAIVRLTLSTAGTDPDPDGVSFRVDQGAATQVRDGATHIKVPTGGTRNWQITDIQPNCALSGGTSGSFTANPGDTVVITTAATCTAVGYGTAGSSATDPAADTLANTTSSQAAHDILQVTSRYASNWLIVVMRFARPVGGAGEGTPAGLNGWLEFDVDENIATGVEPGINFFGGNAQQGVDWGISLFDANATSVRIVKVIPVAGDTAEHRVPLQIEGDSVIIRIPLAKLGGDDGNLSITTVVGTSERPTDIAPNSGVILARQPAGAIMANAVSGADAPRALRSLSGGSGQPRKWRRY